MKTWLTMNKCLGFVVAVWLATAEAKAGNFGKVVPIGGNASDLALDEARGVLYIANFTANRIDVMSLSTNSIQTSMNVAPQPGSLALSPDGKYLVVAHFGNFTAPSTPISALTVIDLTTNGRQTFSLGNPPLGVAFGIDNRALVVTTAEFILFDPVTGATQVVETVPGITAKTLPVPPANFPSNIVASSLATSGDGLKIFGVTAAGSDNLTTHFSYDVTTRRVVWARYQASPPIGPRVISVSKDGSFYAAGWVLVDAGGQFLSGFANPTGILNIGSLMIDQDRGLIYAQMTSCDSAAGGGGGAAGGCSAAGGGAGGGGGTTSAATTPPPQFQVLDIDNLTVIDKYNLPENLSGKSVLSKDGNTMYSVSDSGVMIFGVGNLAQNPRLALSTEDVVFKGNFCDRRVLTQQITITDPGGGRTDFILNSKLPGVTVTPSSGTTPATVRVQVDSAAFQNQKGTVSGLIEIASAASINNPPAVRVLINNKEPDQRGTTVNVPGKLVDLLSDPSRDRFFVLRQDKNQVLVFDGTNFTQVATLKTANTPTQMAVTFDKRYLLIANDNSWVINVYDLETLQAAPPIRMPGGHYPRSIGVSGKSVLVATRNLANTNTIDKVDFITRTATSLPTLGVFENKIDARAVLIGSQNGSSILLAQPDGTVMLYNANADTFTVARKDTTALTGAYAASNFDQYVVGNRLLNSSLVTVGQFESASGTSSGLAFVDQAAVRTTALNSSAPGLIHRVNIQTAAMLRSTRMAEAPILNDVAIPFTRTLAPLFSRNSIVVLTTSGFTALPWNYDASVAAPRLSRIVNAADQSQAVAPGSLVSLFGQDLSPVNIATSQIPLPTALGETCLTVNGVPAPMLFVSPTQINAQLPFQIIGNTTLILRTPGGVSDNFNVTILPAAPGVFRTGTAGPDTGIATVVRDKNQELVTLSNPIHKSEAVTIFLTGMGDTSPAIAAGLPAPSLPLASALIAPVVDINGVGLPVTFAGLTPGQVGVYQINVSVPRNTPTGIDLPLRVTQGGITSTVPVRVVD